MTESSGHERAVGFRIGPQNCSWVIWNIYAKQKKKKKKKLLLGLYNPNIGGRAWKMKDLPKQFPLGRVQSEQW